jgi:heme exporter protein A
MPTEGEVLWKSQDINELREEYFKELSYFGHLNAIKDELTGIENLPTKFLSQGQKRRVALARLLFSQTKLWILDEPFTALDVAAVDFLQSLISQHIEKGGLVILTTHQDVSITADESARQINLDP